MYKRQIFSATTRIEPSIISNFSFEHVSTIRCPKSSPTLTSGKPIIGIAQTGSDISPCNRVHIKLATRIREGIRTAGGIAFEFPVHPIQETLKRPTASLDRNLAYLGLVEILHGYPIDGVVLTTGCDKTTPACLMAAATMNIPAIVLNG